MSEDMEVYITEAIEQSRKNVVFTRLGNEE